MKSTTQNDKCYSPFHEEVLEIRSEGRSVIIRSCETWVGIEEGWMMGNKTESGMISPSVSQLSRATLQQYIRYGLENYKTGIGRLQTQRMDKEIEKHWK